MKKTLSLIMAIVMALSVLSGIGITAVAADIQQVEVCLSKPIIVVENVDGYWLEDKKGKEYFCYEYYFNFEDTIKVTMHDGTKIEYAPSDDAEYWVNENGDVLDWYVYDNQEDEHWGIGEHKASFVVCDKSGLPVVQTDFPVTVIKTSVVNAEFDFRSPDMDKFTITENTMGYWCDDEKDTYFFNYDLEYVFDEGDKIRLTMDDGSSVLYTYTMLEFPEEQWSYAAFVDDEGNELTVYQSMQYDNPWAVGSHTAEIIILDYGVSLEIPVEIVAGTQDDCWHYGDWKTVNGFQVKKCVGCGYEMRLPFKDLRGYESYCDYLAYTSVYNSFIAGTNPPQYTEFSPTTSITRAMLVAIIYRMAGNPYENANPHKTNPFKDVSPSAYYYDAACWALDRGITNQLTFKPNDKVTREQTARFLFAYAESENLLGDDGYKDVDLSEYPDYNKVHSWAVEPLQWANYNDMITGTQQGYINPQGSTQRIHASRILFGFGMTCNLGNYE